MPIFISKYFSLEKKELVDKVEKKQVAFDELEKETQNLLTDTLASFDLLFDYERLEFIKEISQLKDLPEAFQIELMNFNYLSTLPDEVLKTNIGQYIPNKHPIMSTERRALCLFKSDKLSRKILEHTVSGRQYKIEQLLDMTQEKTQVKYPKLLEQSATITDYSGRTFHCTAYEYAYWVKDTHMCRMLERHMNKETKAAMLDLCEKIEENGLKYTQNGIEYCTKHFDFTPLITALKNYCIGIGSWVDVGLAQCDLPAHVIHEYCRLDLSFDTSHTFKEETLPRTVIFFDTNKRESVFPLISSKMTSLGKRTALLRSDLDGSNAYSAPAQILAKVDLAAMIRLDEVRTDDLLESREILKSREPESSPIVAC